MIAQYDTLAELLVKPERPEHVGPVAYPDARVTEMMNLDSIISNVVSNSIIAFHFITVIFPALKAIM